MKLVIRRVGNSLGVLLPKSMLDSWGLGEHDNLKVTERGIRPPKNNVFGHQALDEHKRAIALAVVRLFTPQEIRAQCLANLHRWKRCGSWVSAYDEWHDLIERGGDAELFAAMLGRDEQSNRLRQSPPYVGLLPREEVRKLNEEAAG
jgi:antitoxin component of MazEF toxin-antitoxin module